MKTIKDYAKIARETWDICPHNKYYCDLCESCRMTAIAYLMIMRGEY